MYIQSVRDICGAVSVYVCTCIVPVHHLVYPLTVTRLCCRVVLSVMEGNAQLDKGK